MKNLHKNVYTHIQTFNTNQLLGWAKLAVKSDKKLRESVEKDYKRNHSQSGLPLTDWLEWCENNESINFLTSVIPFMFSVVFEKELFGYGSWKKSDCQFVTSLLDGLTTTSNNDVATETQFDVSQLRTELQGKIDSQENMNKETHDLVDTFGRVVDGLAVEQTNALTKITKKIDTYAESLKEIAKPDQSQIDLAVNKAVEDFRKVDPHADEILSQVAKKTATFKLVKVKDLFDSTEYKYKFDGDKVDFGDDEVQVFDGTDSPVADPNYIFQPRVLHQALNCIKKKLPVPVWLAGQKGTGKTSFVEQLANRLGRQFFRINMRENIDEQIIGGRTTDDQDSSKIVFKQGDFLRAVQISGAFVGLDEFSFIRPQMASLFQPTLETNGNGVRAINVSEECLRVVFSDYVGIFAMDNTTGLGDDSGNHVGVKGQNEALLDRFGKTLLVDYLPFSQEVGLLQKRVGVSEEMAESIIKFAKTSRQKAKDGLLNSPVSLRQLLAWAEGVKDGEPVGLAFESCVLNKFPVDSHPELKAVYEVEIDKNQFKNFARGL